MTTTMEAPVAAQSAQPRPGLTRRRRRGITGVVVGVIVLVALLWSLAPIYWMLTTSFKGGLEATQLNPTYWPKHWTTGNYGELTGGSVPFVSFFVNSVVTSLVAAVICVIVGALGGYSLSRASYRLSGFCGQLILAARILPLVVLVAPLYLVLLKVHLLNSYLGLIIGFTSFGLPFAVWMMKGFIDAVPREIEEAARVDGYGRVGILVRIVLPMSVPGLLTTATFVFMDSWNNLLYPSILMNSQNSKTLTPGLLDSFTGQFKTDWGGMMAAACITSVPLVVVFFAVQRYMVRGLTAGALAGE